MLKYDHEYKYDGTILSFVAGMGLLASSQEPPDNWVPVAPGRPFNTHPLGYLAMKMLIYLFISTII